MIPWHVIQSPGKLLIRALDGTTDRSLSDRFADHGWAPGPAPGVGVGSNICANQSINSINPELHDDTIAGGGSQNFPQVIGSAAGTQASYATISGGYDNVNDMLAGTISGGAHHELSGTPGADDHGTIGGGSYNAISSGHYGTISGGSRNTIDNSGGGSATGATIGGGTYNTAGRGSATVAGGVSNSALGDVSTIAGGTTNTIDGDGSAGSIAGGSHNAITASGATYGAIAGGASNAITGANYGAVSGGLSNTVSGHYGSVGGGSSNAASGQYSRIGGGTSNTASSTRAAVLSGSSNTAQTGDSACVINGQQNTASGAYSTVRGLRGAAAFHGQHVVSGGYFAAVGDAQAWECVVRNTTTNGSAAVLTLDGAGQIPIEDNQTWAFDALIVARRTDAADLAGYRVTGVISRDVGAGTTTVYGVATAVLHETDAAWNATAVANTTSGRLALTVTGAAGKTIRWVGHVRAAAVAA